MYPLSLAGTNSSTVKMQNISAILLALLHNEGVSRGYLAQVLGVSSATITNLVSELARQGHVVETGYLPNEGQVGRRQRTLQIVADSGYGVGVHIDVGTVNIALTNLLGQIIDRVSFSHRLTDSWQHVLDTIHTTVESLLGRHPTCLEQIAGIGIAASGLIDIATGVNIVAPNLNWQNVPIRDYLQQGFNYPVTVENNVRAMALGEALFGDAQRSESLAFIYGRVGGGAGVVGGSQLYRGASAGAGEIGHTLFVFDCEKNPVPLESLLSESAICREAQRLTGESLDLPTILERARHNDPVLCKLLDERAFYLGLVIANLVNTLNPEQVILGGIYQQAEGTMLKTIRDTVRRYAFANLGERVMIQVSTLGRDVGMVGAAALALDAFFYRPQNAHSLQKDAS